jgi:cell division protease FtsH
MDGFHREEMVFVVGTTNFVEILDAALLRPGRFEFHLHIPYPDDDARREIIKIYDKKMRLQMSPEALEYSIRRTSESYPTATGTRYSGDHLNALCRAIARRRTRENLTGETIPDDVERGLTEYEDRVELADKDAPLVATHEAGHFVCALCCPHHRLPERITIRNRVPWVPFVTEFQKDNTERIGYTREELFEMIVVLYGGMEAERLLLGDVSSGAGGFGDPSSDLSRATRLAHVMVEVLGMSEQQAALRVFRDAKGDREVLSGMKAEAIDRQVDTLIVTAQARAAQILQEHRDDLVRLRDELVEKKTIEGDRVKEIIEEFQKRTHAAAPALSAGDGAAVSRKKTRTNGK